MALLNEFFSPFPNPGCHGRTHWLLQRSPYDIVQLGLQDTQNLRISVREAWACLSPTGSFSKSQTSINNMTLYWFFLSSVACKAISPIIWQSTLHSSFKNQLEWPKISHSLSCLILVPHWIFFQDTQCTTIRTITSSITQAASQWGGW